MTRVAVEPLHGPGLLLLDTASGHLAPAAFDARKRGSVTQFEGHVFALYADAGALVFQWDARRWPMTPPPPMRHGHDLATRTSTFSCGERRLTYPAWWADDPAHDPLASAPDADYDDLAWFASLCRQPERLAKLLAAWSADA